MPKHVQYVGWPKRLVLVRHAQSEGNVLSVEERAKLPTPSHRYGLTELGREQARITGEYLQERFGEFDTYYTSDYRRVQETLRIMYPDAKIYEDSRMAEADRGIWHDMTREEIERYYPLEIRRKERLGLYRYRAPGGENWPDIEIRINSFLGTIHRDLGSQNVLMVVHGFWLILLQRALHRFSVDEAMRRYQGHVFDNASVTIYHGQCDDDKSRLVLVEENTVPWKDKLEI